MILILIGSVFAITGLSFGIVAKIRLHNKIKTLSDTSSQYIDETQLIEEFDRIDRLKSNIEETLLNIKLLDVPCPGESSWYDDTEYTLDKLSTFFEEHNLAVAGTEQAILSLLPTSQIGQSLHALTEIIPQNIGSQIFGDAYASIKEGVSNIPTAEGFYKFIGGMGHLSKFQQHSILQHLEHHDFGGAMITPLKQGALEMINAHEAGHNLIASIQDVSADISSSIENCSSIGDLTSVSDIDISGHIPVITIGLSSIREFQLLSQDKTDFITSLKNISLDAAGAGLGAAGGAKLGAIAGSSLGPLGAIGGALVGSIAGAIAGKYATNKVKRLNLDKAISDYSTAYEDMKVDTQSCSQKTLNKIIEYCTNKRTEFHESEVLKEVPIVEGEATIQATALSICHFVINEINTLRKSVDEIKRSFWYSSFKYDQIILEIENKLTEAENSLPSVELLKSDPQIAINQILSLDLPNRHFSMDMQEKINDLVNELEDFNDKNDAAYLMWTYVIKQYYQKTLNEVADFSNSQMQQLNGCFVNWKSKLDNIVSRIDKEKQKLGLS